MLNNIYNNNLFREIEDNKILLWPDVTKHHLQIWNSTLYLKFLWENVKLSDIWKTFYNYENISKNSIKRWD